MSDTLRAIVIDSSPDRELGEALLPVLSSSVSLSSAGYPFLETAVWSGLRDTVPVLFGLGLRVLRFLDAVSPALESADGLSPDERAHAARAARVVRQVVLTATITAPCDLWLMRYVLGTFAELGLLERLLAGEAIYPERTTVTWRGRPATLDRRELENDLYFLLSRGLVEQYETSFRVAGHPRVSALFLALDRLPGPWAEPRSRVWRRLFSGEELEGEELESLLELSAALRPRVQWRQNHWLPTIEEVEIGHRLVPVVLGLRAAGKCSGLVHGATLRPLDWSARHPLCASGAMETLTYAGWLERQGESYRVTEMGERGLARAPGPFGIIESYQPYLARGCEMLVEGQQQVWVRRGENLGASQDANRKTFRQANDALDRFCEQTGFRYDVFIEHAIGRGEATRQRFERSGDEVIRYFGADLEDAAIDAAIAEQQAGRLPSGMRFVRSADIGEPEVLLEALRSAGCDPQGAVMLVGNGFHEVRNQSRGRMIAVFREYCEAGIVLLFTEENALSVDDLRATAWNTFHAGFKYVHEKSGQGLRPAEARPHVRLGAPLRAAWNDCATHAGYVRLEEFSSRSRTIYPSRPAGSPNPSISANHFFVPLVLVRTLSLEVDSRGEGAET